jgi:CRP-like cAMP-binding protein
VIRIVLLTYVGYPLSMRNVEDLLVARQRSVTRRCGSGGTGSASQVDDGEMRLLWRSCDEHMLEPVPRMYVPSDRQLSLGPARLESATVVAIPKRLYVENDLRLSTMVDKLEWRSRLVQSERDALMALPFRVTKLDRENFIIREGDRLGHVFVLLWGFVCCHRINRSGSRQITSVHMAGDLLDLQNGGEFAACNVQALSPTTVALIPRAALFALAMAQPSIATALWRDAGANAQILAEWLLNIGRRCARSRIAHLICELVVRQEVAGLSTGPDYCWALTQEQIGDATGLTTVHVNRTMQSLRNDGLLQIKHGKLSILDWSDLRAMGDFDPNYLQLPQARMAASDQARRMA